MIPSGTNAQQASCPFSGFMQDSPMEATKGDPTGKEESPCPVSGDAGRRALDHEKKRDLLEDATDLCENGEASKPLEESAREAWRHSVRCIGRLHWQSLQVIDARSAEDTDEIFEACAEHLRQATNNGKVTPTQTVFRPWDGPEREARIWNTQLIRYAGYRLPDGSVLGDPAQVKLTELAMALGWKAPSEPGAFDVLPLIIQMGEDLAIRELSRRDILEVQIEHPEHAWLGQLKLRWHAVPAISDMILATGTEAYGCAPFNGWYMGTEIGARNFGDEKRYNLLPTVADRMGLTTSRNTLWKDHALLVLNEAVLYSFEKQGVRLVSHHQASKEFMTFRAQEEAAGRKLQADWSWIVPPLSGSTMEVFHHSFELAAQLPNLLPQRPAWETERGRKILSKFL